MQIDEEQLSELISVLFDWLEWKNEQFFHVDGQNLRSALERYFYFSGLSDIGLMRPLIEATKEWRKSAKSELIDLYDGIYQKTRITLLAKARFSLRDGLRLLAWKLSSCSEESLQTSASTSNFGFFPGSKRFLKFFEPLAIRLGRDCSVFYSLYGELGAGDTFVIKTAKSSNKNKKVVAEIHYFHPLMGSFLLIIKIYQQALGLLASNMPSVLIFAEGTSVEDAIMASVARKLGVPTIRVQSGRAGILHSGYRNMPYDYMLCWGEGFVERFQKFSPNPKYYVTGNPALDSSIKSQAGSDFTIAVFTQPISAHVQESDYFALAKLCEDLLETIPILQLRVRHHPADSQRLFDELAIRNAGRVSIMNTDTHDLDEVLSGSSLALGFFSTTLSEAAAYGVIAVILKLRDQHSVFPFPEKHGAAVVANSSSEVISVILDYVSNPKSFDRIRQNMQHFANQFFGPQDGRALERMTRIIQSVATKKSYED